MDNHRRKTIELIVESLDTVFSEIEVVESEEQEYLDNMPENLVGSERYERSEEALSSISEAEAAVQEAIDNLNSAIE